MTGSGSLSIPRAEGAKRVMVGWICPGDVTNTFASSLVDTLIRDPDRRIQGQINLQSSPRIVQARTDMVSSFLETDIDWLLTVDADMSWNYEDFDKVLRAADKERRPIVGGLCFGGGRIGPDGETKIFPTLYDIRPDGDTLRSELILDYPRNKIFEVSATGAAFMLVHRRVFTHMQNMLGAGNPFPWYAETILRGKPTGEDITFCIRATSLGFKVFVHTGAKIRHEKRTYLTEAMYDESRAENLVTA
jgi:hypothetical protein